MTSKRKSKLRLDTEAGAKSDLGGHFAIVPGEPGSSELIRRVTSSDTARRMPPAYAGAAQLCGSRDRSADALDRARRAMAEALVIHAAVRPALPEISDRELAEESDRLFVMARLDREGLEAFAGSRPAHAPAPRLFRS